MGVSAHRVFNSAESCGWGSPAVLPQGPPQHTKVHIGMCRLTRGQVRCTQECTESELMASLREGTRRHLRVPAQKGTCAHVHAQAPLALAPTPRGELAARQAPRFLLGVHNLSQALIESRVIYNAAVPLPKWASLSCCSPGLSLCPCTPSRQRTGSHAWP